MSFSRPSLDQLIDRVKSDIKSTVGIVNILRRSFFSAISRAMGGLAHLLYGYLDYISLQVFPDTADAENLENWCRIWKIERKESTYANFNILVTGAPGATVIPGTIYQRSDGLRYTVDSEILIGAGGSSVGALTAVMPGSTYNNLAGDIISLLSPVANIDSDAVVDSIVIEAEDTESDELLRSRLLTRLRLPPLGGSANDYIQWALEVPGVTRAWVLPLYTGPGTVSVSFVDDSQDPIIPGAAKVQEVQEYIDLLKPVTALFTAFAPTAAPMTMTISIQPNTLEVHDNVISELQDMIKRDATLAGSYKAPGVSNDGSILLSKINQAISIAVGVDDFNIDLINGNVPANVVPNNGELVTLGDITWQPLV